MADPTTLDTIRAGDHVLHAPTGETWVVAWADPTTGDLAWCGWPNGTARLSDCTLVRAASHEEHQQKLRELKASGDSRGAKALRLYGEPTFVPLVDAAVASIDTCATAFLTDQRVLPADQADERLWGPWAGYDTTVAEQYDEVDRVELSGAAAP